MNFIKKIQYLQKSFLLVVKTNHSPRQVQRKSVAICLGKCRKAIEMFRKVQKSHRNMQESVENVWESVENCKLVQKSVRKCRKVLKYVGKCRKVKEQKCGVNSRKTAGSYPEVRNVSLQATSALHSVDCTTLNYTKANTYTNTNTKEKWLGYQNVCLHLQETSALYRLLHQDLNQCVQWSKNSCSI